MRFAPQSHSKKYALRRRIATGESWGQYNWQDRNWVARPTQRWIYKFAGKLHHNRYHAAFVTQTWKNAAFVIEKKNTTSGLSSYRYMKNWSFENRI